MVRQIRVALFIVHRRGFACRELQLVKALGGPQTDCRRVHCMSRKSNGVGMGEPFLQSTEGSLTDVCLS